MNSKTLVRRKNGSSKTEKIDSQMTQKIVQDNSRPFKLVKIPTQVPLNAFYEFATVEHFQLVGGLYPFVNLPLFASLYRVRSGVNTTYPALTNIQQRYQAFVILRFKVKLTISNNTAYPTSLNLTAKRSPAAGGQTSLVKDYLLPYTKQAMIGSIDGSRGTATIVSAMDPSTLFGYDTTQTNMDSHTTSSGSSPAYTSGFSFVAYTLDGSSIPSIQVRAEYKVMVRGVYPIPLLD